MAPVLRAFACMRAVDSRLCVTGQHRALLDQALALFGLRPDCDLALMIARQSPAAVTARVEAAVAPELRRVRPDWVIVQGDTASALGTARAAANAGIPLAHVEAGLRSGNPESPWPEELNRCEITSLAQLHFAPTPLAAAILLEEGISAHRVLVTGNPVIDALKWMQRRLDRDPALAALLRRRFDFLDPRRRMILATIHRREQRCRRISAFGEAVLTLADSREVQIVVPLHPDPGLSEPLIETLSGRRHIHLLPAIDYAGCVHLLRRAALVLTDSGGLQEEAPALGKPVLVLRDGTERPEAIHAGAAQLTGLSAPRIIGKARALLDDPERYAGMARPRQVFGDGLAAPRIARGLLRVARRERARPRSAAEPRRSEAAR